MKIEDIKEKSRIEMKELNLSKRFEKVHIGLKKFEVTYGGKYMSTNMEPDISAFQNHIIVNLDFQRYGALRKEDMPEDYRKIFQVMVNYWKGYANHKKKDGVLFLSKEKEYYEYDFEDTETNMTKKEREVVLHYVQKNLERKYVYGGNISEGVKADIGNFLVAKETVESIMKQYTLLTFINKQMSVMDMYRYVIAFNYAGEKMNFYPEDDYRKLRISRRNGDEVTIDFTVSAIAGYLEELKDYKKLINEFESPKENYMEAVVKMNLFDSPEEVLNAEYEKLLLQFKDWETVEEHFVQINKKRPKKIINLNDETTLKQLVVYRTKNEGYYFYFINTSDRANNKYETSFEIIATKEEGKEDVKRILSDKIMPDI